MILYNVTANVENAILIEWIKWMIEIHIPEVMATGMFQDHKMYRLLIDDENDTSTFSIQYFANDIGKIDEYLQHHAPGLKKKHVDKYGAKVVTFRTVMEEIDG
jgi:hypothetical protein